MKRFNLQAKSKNVTFCAYKLHSFIFTAECMQAHNITTGAIMQYLCESKVFFFPFKNNIYRRYVT